MRFFVFGREIIPKWFAKAVNDNKVVYEYNDDHIIGFKIVDSGEIGTFGSVVCKALDDTIRVIM